MEQIKDKATIEEEDANVATTAGIMAMTTPSVAATRDIDVSVTILFLFDVNTAVNMRMIQSNNWLTDTSFR
jgi:hypothetical protein